MKKLLLVGVLLFSSPVMAQEKEYNINLTAKEIDYIYGKLTEMPFKDVFQIVNKIQTQVLTQNQQTAKPIQVEPKKE